MTLIRRPIRPPYDGAPFPTATLVQASAVIDRYQLDIDPRKTKRVNSSGNVHSVYRLGDKYILKIPRDHPRAIGETLTASVAVPAATSAGVRTGSLVAFDDSLEIFSVPFSVFEYVRGESVTPSARLLPSDAAVWHDVGRELATLHNTVGHVDDPNGWLEEWTRPLDHAAILTGLVEAGVLASHSAEWFDELLNALKPSVSGANRYRRFVHGDLKPGNVVRCDGRLSALIDWDDAGWFDPAIDFAQIPLQLVDVTLAGYRAVAPLDGDDTAEQRILWDHVMTALTELWRLRIDMAKVYHPCPGDGLVEVLALAVDGTSSLLQHFPVRRGLAKPAARG
ncbi:phosphotransferase enzyme family protein [Micromonospora tarapacensis]|uniref:phosphotransferase enzyme family protein n=1 Tax=Micromonospora tarapacensis TaxID=2835305 RepID=UPI001E509DFE|nr:aminoglycoside phosphotransferase family protein [Micromonospora tarapacensis]